jgi:hypothetical protein
MPSFAEKYKRRQRIYIRKYLLEHKTTQVEMVDGYSDPIFVCLGMRGGGYRALHKKIRVGRLFLLGKIY